MPKNEPRLGRIQPEFDTTALAEQVAKSPNGGMPVLTEKAVADAKKWVEDNEK